MLQLKNTLSMTKVKKSDLVTVYGTGNGNLAHSKAYKVHALVAEKLIKSGDASKAKPSGKPEKGEPKDA
jgi:hypothetical protein